MVEEMRERIDGFATHDDVVSMVSRMIELKRDFAELDKKITRHRGNKYVLPFVLSALTCIIGLTSPMMGTIAAGLASIYLLIIAFIGD